MIEAGKKAPAFALQDQDGATVRLADFAGKTLLLFVYPKANTGGCTTEATEFRDAKKEFDKKGVVIVGLSKDKPEAQKKWAEKYALPFTLLCDPETTTLAAYGAFGEKTMYGKIVTGTIRSTFVIGPDGKIVRIYRKVKAKGHAAQVLADLT
jgi:peroxiredoxin Q/BCP